MSLDSWESYVVDNNLSPDLSLESSIFEYGKLKTRCNEAYEYLKEAVDLKTDYDELLDLLADENIYQVANNHNVAVRDALNEYIQEALDTIEDKQNELYQEDCCIAAFKRNEEFKL